MHRMIWALALCLVTGAVQGDEGAVTIGDLTTWTIVCDPAAIESERYAAEQFQALFEGLTGAHLDIAETAPGDGGMVVIGPDAVERVTGAKAVLDEEELRIQVEKGRVLIDGGRPRGTLYGVFEFFEEWCGVRYLTHDHTWFPPNAVSRTLPVGTYTYRPDFAFRWSYYGETNTYHDFAARLRTNTVSDDPRLGGKTGYRLVSHNVAYLLPPATYGKDHPEYYALVNGQRKLEMGGGGPQLCMTNPEVLELVTQAVLAEIEKNPTAKNINIAQMDNESYCTCEACAAVDAREESHAGSTLALVNAVAERIEKSHPDVLISTYAYQYTRKPPKNLRARPNVMIQLCSIECCDVHAIDDPSCALNRAFCEDMAGWKEKADRIFIWHYNTNFKGYLLPFPNLRAIGPSVTYFHKNHGQGVFMQAGGNAMSAELSDLRNYVMSRCLWKPGRDSWKEAEEFVRLHYAEAAQPILDYLAYYHDLVDKAGVHPTCFPTESSLAIDPESSRRIMRFFQEALRLAASDEVRARVEKASLCAYRAALSASSMKLVFDDGVCKPDLSGLEPDLLDRYAQLCERYGVTMEDEMTPVGQYIDSLRKFHEGLKAVKLENDVWRVVVLPESNAKVVEMTYKPTGRNVAYAARALNRFRFEDWVRQGEGPGSQNIVPFDAKSDGTRATFTHVTPDGSCFERSLTLDGDAVRFEMALTAGESRMADFAVHPEYDAASFSNDPNVVSVYVKAPEWLHANRTWSGEQMADTKMSSIAGAVEGGVFAFFNHEAGFGVEQRFASNAYESLGLFWSPSRRQVNLELFPHLRPLEKGEQMRYGYEVRYLAQPPIQSQSR